MEILDYIWAARNNFLAKDPQNARESLLLLVSHETLRELYRSKLFVEENVMTHVKADSPQTIFGIRIVETGDVTGWKLVKIESEGE